MSKPNDSSAAALGLERRSTRRFDLRFQKLEEERFRRAVCRDNWIRRSWISTLFALLFLGAFAVLQKFTAQSIRPNSFDGLLLLAGAVPALALVALTSTAAPLRRFSEAVALIAIPVTAIAVARLQHAKLLPSILDQRLDAAMAFSIFALLMFKLPAGRAIAVTLLSGIAVPFVVSGGAWPAEALRVEWYRIVAYLVPVAYAAYQIDADTRQNWQSAQLLEAAARQDYLTGLMNRRSFEEAASKLLADAWKHGKASALMLLDIDFFKLINDRYGHARGDQVLKAVAAVIARSPRNADDLCARHGGEEFVVLWTDCNTTTARRNADTLLLEIRRLGIENEGSSVASVVTASAGLVAWEKQTAVDLPEVLNEADHLLYEAKRSGRNRLVTQTGA